MMFKDLKLRASILWGILTGTIAVSAIYYLFHPAVVFGGH